MCVCFPLYIANDDIDVAQLVEYFEVDVFLFFLTTCAKQLVYEFEMPRLYKEIKGSLKVNIWNTLKAYQHITTKMDCINYIFLQDNEKTRKFSWIVYQQLDYKQRMVLKHLIF